MNAGELVVSLILSAGDFKAQVQAAQKGLDGVQAAAVDAGRDVSDAAERGGRGLDNLGSAARSAGKELEEAGNRGSLSFENLKGTLTKVFGVIGGVAFIKSQFAEFTEAALEVDTASKTLGMDIKEFQGWQNAAEKVGLETRDLVQLFGDVSDRMYDAVLHDSGPFKDAVDDIGISLKGVKEGATSSADMLLQFARAVEKMPKDKAHGLLAQYGFDPESIKLIMMGEKELEKLIKTGKEKARFDKRDIENAQKLREAQQRLNAAWRTISALFASTVSPAVTFLTNLLGDLLGWVKENKQFVILFFTGLAGVITTLMLPALTAMATAAWAAIAPFAPLIAIVGAVALVIDDLITYIQGGESAFGDFWKMFGEGDELGARFKSLWEGIKSILASVGAALKAVAKFFILIFSLTGEGVIAAIDGIWKGITNLYNTLVEMLNWVAQKLYNLLPDWIKDWLGGDESSRPEETKAEAKRGGVADSMRVDDVRPSILPPQVRAGDARPGSVSNVNNSSRQTVFNNDIEIVTQATDGQGLAQELDRTWRNQTAQADSAFGY
ncbi:hypothetical protein AB4095_16685 [Bilophila wadsworthia]|uniref:hypothetical protein n=1 Tax=Bilophila wadsworthia TaxID=35833 RepID=UPI0034CDFA63